MILQKSETKNLQGIAILFMLGLHLFNRIDIENYYDVYLWTSNGVPVLTSISYIFDACVPIYLFCSGYGLYISEEKQASVRKRLQRIFKLLVRFWIVMILTCIVGFSLGMRDRYPGSALNFILNALLVKGSYVGAFWFIQTYTLLVLCSGWIHKIVKKYSYILVIGISFVLYGLAFVIEYKVIGMVANENLLLVINALMLLLRSQFSFVIGMCFVKEDLFDSYDFFKKIRQSKWIPWLGLIILIIIRAKLTHMIFAPFSAIALIVLFGTYRWGKLGKNILAFFGKHSTNMWLTHMQFYMIFTPRLVFASRNVGIIFLTLIVLSLIASFVVDIIYDMVFKVIKKSNKHLCEN